VLQNCGVVVHLEYLSQLQVYVTWKSNPHLSRVLYQSTAEAIWDTVSPSEVLRNYTLLSNKLLQFSFQNGITNERTNQPTNLL